MRLLISGYYGFGNAGDEAVLAGMLQALRRAGNVEPVVLSGDPEATRALHGVEAVSRDDPRAVWRALGRADLLISGGGGLLQDRTSARSSLYYLGVIELAHRAGIPVYLYAQGVGPLRRPWLRKTAAVALRRVRGAGVRDRASQELLEALGVPAARIQVTADAAFALNAPEPAIREEAQGQPAVDKAKRPLIGVVWRRPFSEDGLDPERCRQSAGEQIGRLARQLCGTVFILPFHPAFDGEEARALAQAVAGEGARVTVGAADASGARTGVRVDPWSLLALLGRMDLVVGVRFHALVFSALSGAPAVAVSYDPKVRHLAEALGVPWVAPANEMSQLADALTRAWEERAGLSRSVSAKAGEFRALALAEGERAVAVAAGREGAGGG